MISMNKISFSIVLGFFSGISYLPAAFSDTPPTQASTADISGTYLCTYHDPVFSTPPDGTELLAIKKISDTHYTMSKKGVNDTTPVLIGVGLPNIEHNNVISFLFWRPTASTSTFVQYITVQPDGTLKGSWAVSNKSGTATFNCKKSTS